ncbi:MULTISPECIES: restriction endonuclease subunit S [Clostridium]|uniref:restriction endonuclease subunit S n=1 Tax=Clostridium TaxID=1485 RepID=UPI00242F43AB|nr:restriction endonuclease subunit S [Clostridium tyrobutyricum]
MKLNDRKWKEFKVDDIFEIFNSVPYHKNNLISNNDENNSIPYITRTNKNNGLEDIVEKRESFKTNPKDIIIFGAENATFFYQPFEHITGNKMYGVKNNMINKYVGLFIQQMLNKSIKDCGFCYGQGLTGAKEKRRNIMLPVMIEDDTKPDWQFMDDYIKGQEELKKKKYFDYIKDIVGNLEYKKILSLEKKEWKSFYISDIFNIEPGKRLTKTNMISGDMPFIGSTDSNNGITNFVSNINISLDMNVLGVNYNGSVVQNFYHPYKCIFSDDVKRFHLKQQSDNKYILLFFKTIILKQKNKYTYGYKFNENRMKRQKILVPINEQNSPDYKYMEQYIKNIMITKYKEYILYNN